MPYDERSMATRMQAIGGMEEADFEMYRRKLPLTDDAKTKGTFEHSTNRYSPKGLIPAKYLFLGELELNQFETPNSRKFWRCETFSIHKFGEKLILDYEVNNISTLLASESIQIMSTTSQNPIGYSDDEQKLINLQRIKRNIVEVVEQITNSRYQDYYPVKWKIVTKREFIDFNKEVLKTLTVKKYEQLNDVDIVNSFRNI